ncbi:MAG: TonB-dependent receptor [Bacteroidales bacterium]|jgi:hypothetical protein|nr:TonB-dependent receptor [Bacteroidales bacterium]
MKKIQITFALLFLTGSLFAQVSNEQVTVIAPFQPMVLDAHKINVTPQTIDSALRPREARFDILSRKVVTSFGMDHIRPARVAGEPLSKLSPLHVRGGFGNYATAYGELFYGSERSAQWQYGAHLKHNSSRGTFKNHEVPFDNSVNLIKLFGDYFGRKALVSANFYYDRQRYSAYGADVVFLDFWSNFKDDNYFKIVYNNTGGSIGFSDNNTEPNSLGYSGKLNIDVLQPNIIFLAGDKNEVSLNFTGNIHHTFDLGHPIFEQTVLGLDGTVDWHTWHLHRINDPKMFKFHPYGKLRFSGHDFSLGLRVNAFGTLDGDFFEREVKTEWQVIPTIHAKFNLIDNLLAIEFGLDGDVQYMTHKKMARINPFVFWWPMEAFSHPQRHWESYLGLNTMLSKTIDFALKGRLVSYKNLMNFDVSTISIRDYDGTILSSISMPFFDPTYDTVNCFQLQADLNYHLDEKIAVSVMARGNFYDKDILYKPKYEANLAARYNIQDKIILKTQLYFSSGTKYHDFSKIELIKPKLETFDPIIDWSIGAEYRFNRRWSAFLDVNNILNQRYYHWYNYRSFRTNFLIGATFNL